MVTILLGTTAALVMDGAAGGWAARRGMLAASAVRAAEEAAVVGAQSCAARHVGASGGTGLVVVDDGRTRRGLCGCPRGGEWRATANF